MGSRRTLIDVVVVGAIGVLCLPILLWLAPYMETSREEVRLEFTYGEVRRLHSTIDDAPMSMIELEESDPWGEPFRVIPDGSDSFRVVSSGPDMSLSSDGAQGDDISSDMPESPMKSVLAQKNRQWLIAFAVTIGTWVLLATLYIRSRHVTAD